MDQFHVLFGEPNVVRYQAVFKELSAQEGIKVTSVQSWTDISAALKSQPVDAALLGSAFDKNQAFVVHQSLRKLYPNVVRLMLVDEAGRSEAMSAMEDNAIYSFLLDPVRQGEATVMLKLAHRYRNNLLKKLGAIGPSLERKAA